MGIDFLKNPIVLGIVATVLTYIYFHWKAEQEHKKNPEAKRKRPNFLIPGIAGLITWFLASSYFDQQNPKLIEQSAGYQDPHTAVHPPTPNSNANEVMDSAMSSASNSYHLIGKNKVRLPPTDVFIDIAKF